MTSEANEGTGGGGEYIPRSLSFPLNSLMKPLFLRTTVFGGMLPEGMVGPGIGGLGPNSDRTFPPVLADRVLELGASVSGSEKVGCAFGTVKLLEMTGLAVALRERSRACARASSREISLMEDPAGLSPKPVNAGLLTSLMSLPFMRGLAVPCPFGQVMPFIIDKDENDGLLTSTGLDMPRLRALREDESL